jgi:PAS domain S-box-containing protein
MNKSPINFPAIIEGISTAFIALDEQGCFIYMNTAAERLLENRNNFFEGRHISDVFTENRWPGFLQLFQKVETQQQYFSEAIRHLQQEQWYELHIHPLPNGFAVMVHHIPCPKKEIGEIAFNEKRFRALVEHNEEIITLIDAEQNVLYRNNAAEKITGYSNEIFTGGSRMQHIHNDDRSRIQEIIQQSITSPGKIWPLRFRIKHKNGNYVWLEGSITNKLDDPRLCGILTNLRDVTQRVEAEATIKKSNERFNIVTTATNDMIWDWNLETDELWWNHNYHDLIGYGDNTKHHTISSWISSVHPDDRERVVTGIYKVINSGEVYWCDEYRYLKSDGTVLYTYDRGYVSHDDSGKPYRMIGSMLDITGRILAEQAVRESEEKYRTLVEQASDAILIADGTGRFITVNTSACKMADRTEAELLQMSLYDFAIIDEIRELPLRFADLRKGETVVTERSMNVRSGLVRQVEITAKLLSDGRILVFVRDISERVKAQNEIIKEKNLSDSIINSLPGIFYLYDEKGNFLRWNKNLEVVSGYDAQEIRNILPIDFFDAEEKPKMKEMGREVFGTGMASREANFLRRNKQRVPYYFTGWRVIFEGKPCLIGVGMDITEKRKSEELLQKSYEDLRALAAHLTRVREEERKRIGREIHDELGQQLTAIKMDVAWMDKKIPPEARDLKVKLKNIITLLDESNRSVRRILSELSPGIIDNNGLLEALENLNRQFTATTGIPVLFTTKEKKIILSQDIANCIYRVYQESLTNIMRYAKAKQVIASIDFVEDNIRVAIADDGTGFNATSVRNNKSFGILGMKERVLSFGGSFHLQTKKGMGTGINIEIPFRTTA